MKKFLLVLCLFAVLALVGCTNGPTGNVVVDTALLGAGIGVAVCCTPCGLLIGATVGAGTGAVVENVQK